MKTAILADIHSNWEALQAVSDYLDKQRIKTVVHLGDAVGYGANPNECFEWVQQHAQISILGNHENALFDEDLRLMFSLPAKEAIEWTQKQINPAHLSAIKKLPYTFERAKISGTHGSFDDPPSFSYLTNFADAQPSIEVLRTFLGFFAHTHVPSMFNSASSQMDLLFPGSYKVSPHQKTLINPGSVGQPRDGDKRASFGIWDDETSTFELIRLDYDRQTASQKILEAGLPASLGKRLL